MVAEHDDEKLNSITLNAISAASKLGDVSVLVAGANAKKVAEQVGCDRPSSSLFLRDKT